MWRNVAICGYYKQKILEPHYNAFHHIEPQNDFLKCGKMCLKVVQCG